MFKRYDISGGPLLQRLEMRALAELSKGRNARYVYFNGFGVARVIAHRGV